MKGGNNPIIAEAMSIIKVVNKVIELGFHYMHFETDNALLKQLRTMFFLEPIGEWFVTKLGRR